MLTFDPSLLELLLLVLHYIQYIYYVTIPCAKDQ